jgi:general secretion pathway protein B
MSFILDALKKSENDRQRQSGPALFEVRVAPPKSKFPPWAIALVALLVVNLGVIGWLMLRKPAAAATTATPAANPVTGVPITPPAPVPAPAGPPAQLATAPVTAPPQAAPPPATAYGPPPAAQHSQQQYEQNPTLQDSRQAYTGGPQPQQPQRAYVPEDRFNNAPPLDAEGNPDDYAPAAEPTGEAPFGHVRRGLPNGLMTYEEAATKNQIPPLRMDLHVYAPDPRRRFVLVNMKRLTEGESLPEGVKVESITTDGAVLSYRGVQFMMERD